jgi:DNA primase
MILLKNMFLNTFLEKIAELTPHSNQNKKKFYVKKTKSLDSTKKYFNESQSISGVELKEFSLLYLLLNNLSFFQANIHLVENVKLFTEINKQIFNSIIVGLNSGEQMSIESFNLDKQLLDKINKFAPIKHILKNKLDNHDQVIELLDDISKDLFNYDLEFRIQELESRFSKDMSETTFNELKELKNERKNQLI